MHARLVAVLAVLWVSVAVTATGLDHVAGGEYVAGSAESELSTDFELSTVPAPASASRQGQDPAKAKPFRHSEHVSEAWFEGGDSGEFRKPEVFRDCRGCHRFSPENEFSSPQAECDNCHVGAGKLQTKFDEKWQKDLSAHQTRTGPAFRHYTHGMLECRECHAQPFSTPHLPIQTGAAFCATCHEKTVTAEKVASFKWLQGVEDVGLARAVGLKDRFTKPVDAKAYVAVLDQVFAGPTGGINTVPLLSGGDFDHADHINTVPGMNQGLACSACHVNIEKAGATEVGTGVIPTDGCKKCHIRNAEGLAAEPVKSSKQTDPKPLWSLGTFAHSDHFGFLPPGRAKEDKPCLPSAYEAIRGKECAACHTYAPEVPGLSERDFPFDSKASKHTYADCLQCHAVAGWQTGEQPGSVDNPPLHTSNGGTGWRECAACHELGQPDMADLRPQESVKRWREVTFVFEGQTHPHITTAGIAEATARGDASLQKDCASCHRAVVPQLPTRLIEKAFTHKTHLPANPTAKDCAGCHETAKDAANALALGGLELRTYTLKSCATCHWGGDVTVRAEPKAEPAASNVVAFPHGTHVQAGQSCLDCHAIDAAGRDILTNEAAVSCKQCHKHEAVDGKRPKAERLVASEVASCVRCHHEDRDGAQIASVPPPRGSAAAAYDARYQSSQTVFAGFEQSQFHPAGSTCTDCHTRMDTNGKFVPIAVRTRASHISASHAASLHANAPVGFGRSAPADCLRCHWKVVDGWVAAVKVAADEPPGTKEFRQNPASRKARDRFGNRFAGYPSSKAEG